MPAWQAWMFGLVPSIGVGLLFWYAMRAVVRSDRNERAEIARIEAADKAREAGQAEKAREAEQVEKAREAEHVEKPKKAAPEV